MYGITRMEADGVIVESGDEAKVFPLNRTTRQIQTNLNLKILDIGF